MTDDPKKRLRDVREEIDLRLDGLLGQLGASIGDMLGRLEEGAGELHHSRTVETERGPVRAEAGIRIRVGGIEAERATQPTQRPSTAPPKPAPEPPRPVAATILAEPDLWSLTAELPGVTQADLRLDVDGVELTIEAEARGRRFRGVFTLPPGIRRDDLSVSLRNGILDLTAPKPGDQAP